MKLLITKGFLFISDLIPHQFLKAPLQLVLVELPLSVFGTVGSVAVYLLNIEFPSHAVGNIIAYPVRVATIVGVVERPPWKFLASNWLGATIITALSVGASLGIAPHPLGMGSGLTYYLKHHIVAELLRESVLTLGRGIQGFVGFMGL